ncbi:MAG: DUF2007 domain-containing protein [Thermanaerothrix sp.]|nr:DUF2007 domain-containing protein [Thermanaerothrix sp.]
MPPNPSAYEEVYRANGRLHADIIRGFLEAAGFTVVLYQESAGVVYGLTVGPLGEVRILVPSEQAAEAKALLAAMDRGETDTSEDDEVDLNETPSNPDSPC